MNYTQFVNENLGKFVEFNGDQYKNQCTDMVWKYIVDVVGTDPNPYKTNAKNIFYNFASNAVFQKIVNLPTNFPSKGDIVFYDYSPSVLNPYGHVDICDTANLNVLNCFSQNWPLKSPCHFIKHTYGSRLLGWRVIGWFHPLKNVNQ